MQQCREGWHLTEDPPLPERGLDQEPGGHEENEGPGRSSNLKVSGASGHPRRRQDAPDLPRVPMEDRTTGQAFTAPDGTCYRPSMFITWTLPSYGKVIPGTGIPADPARYDYRRAALDALHFPCSSTGSGRTCAAAPGSRSSTSPQSRPSAASPRTCTPPSAAPSPGRPSGRSPRPPTSSSGGPPSTRSATTATGCRFGTARPADTATPTPADRCAPSGTPSTSSTTTPTPHPPTWCASGSRPTSKDCSPGQRTPSAVGYLCKYLTKSVADTYADPATSGLTDDQHTAYEAHIDRLHEQVLWPPCSPECANWLRYGIQPDAAGPGLTPGMCPAPHHDRENLGIGGRRVPVSRQWSGKTLTEHRADRAAVVRQALEAAGIDAPEADRRRRRPR